jgi:excinuclease ABC subunit C
MKSINETLKQIPALPGIYKMLDASGQIIYIGKSKCLKKRVRSYFSGTSKKSKIIRMVQLIESIEYIVTDTHLEARLLECQLIKDLKPYFNSQMKNDQRYSYLKINDNPRLKPLSIVHDRGKDTYGPFHSRHFIQSFIDKVTHLFPLVYLNRHYTFSYHLFPETLSPDLFLTNRETLIQLFSGELELEQFMNALALSMDEEAIQYRYERAMVFRDLIQSLKYIRRILHDYQKLITGEHLLKIAIDEGIKLFFVAKGNVIHKKFYSALTPPEQCAFVCEGQRLANLLPPNADEKREMDFLNILFSEMQVLPDDWVISLDVK